MQAKFGPSSNGDLFYEKGFKHSYEMPAFLCSLGLTAYEYSFGRGSNITDEMALTIGKNCAAQGIALSVHAPYYINFANPDREMIEKSFGYLFRSADKARLMGGNRVVFHTGTTGKMTRREALDTVAKNLQEFALLARQNGYGDMFFCPETMGKINQIGTAEEIINFCLIDEIFIPTVDFGHLYARTHGEFQGFAAYDGLLSSMKNALGDRAKNMHVHFSKIQFSAGGEVKHLKMSDTTFGPDFAPLAKAFVKHGFTPVILSESDGSQVEDALEMKNIYEKIKEI